MINRFTLQFKDQKIEEQFQKYWLNTKRKPLLKIIMIGIVIIVFIFFLESLITGIIYQQSFLNYIYGYLGYLSQSIMFFIIYKWKPKYIRAGLLFYNHMLAFGYVSINYSSLDQIKMMTFITVSVQLVIIFTGEFIEACYQIICFAIVYLTNKIFYDKEIQSYDTASLVFIIVIVIITHHRNQLAFRSQFQLSFNDQQWERILQSTIKKEYLIFSYNEQSISFNLRSSSLIHQLIKDDKQLINYIREVKLDCKLNLEQFCFNEIKSYQYNNDQKTINKNLTAHYKKQKLFLECLVIYGTYTMIMIQFSFTNELEQYDDEPNNQLPYKIKYQKLLKKMCSILFYKKFKNQLKDFYIQTHQLKQYCLVGYFQELEIYQQFSEISQFNYQQIEIILNKMYFGQKKILITSSVKLINCNKQFFILLLMQIIENVLNTNINITITINSKLNLEIIFNECLYKQELKNMLKKQKQQFIQLFLECEFKDQSIKLQLQDSKQTLGDSSYFKKYGIVLRQ